jgi:hypothetical protein
MMDQEGVLGVIFSDWNVSFGEVVLLLFAADFDGTMQQQ